MNWRGNINNINTKEEKYQVSLCGSAWPVSQAKATKNMRKNSWCTNHGVNYLMQQSWKNASNLSLDLSHMKV